MMMRINEQREKKIFLNYFRLILQLRQRISFQNAHQMNNFLWIWFLLCALFYCVRFFFSLLRSFDSEVKTVKWTKVATECSLMRPALRLHNWNRLSQWCISYFHDMFDEWMKRTVSNDDISSHKNIVHIKRVALLCIQCNLLTPSSPQIHIVRVFFTQFNGVIFVYQLIQNDNLVRIVTDSDFVFFSCSHSYDSFWQIFTSIKRIYSNDRSFSIIRFYDSVPVRHFDRARMYVHCFIYSPTDT